MQISNYIIGPIDYFIHTHMNGYVLARNAYLRNHTTYHYEDLDKCYSYCFAVDPYQYSSDKPVVPLIFLEPKLLSSPKGHTCYLNFINYILHDDQNTGTTSSAWKKLWNAYCNNTLTDIITKTNDIYYGNSTIIMDKNMHLLYILMGTAFKNGDEVEKKVFPLISDRVFHNENKNTLLHKSIRNDVLPLFTSKGISVPKSNLDHFTVKHVKALPSNTVVEVISKFVVESFEKWGL